MSTVKLFAKLCLIETKNSLREQILVTPRQNLECISHLTVAPSSELADSCHWHLYPDDFWIVLVLCSLGKAGCERWFGGHLVMAWSSYLYCIGGLGGGNFNLRWGILDFNWGWVCFLWFVMCGRGCRDRSTAVTVLVFLRVLEDRATYWCHEWKWMKMGIWAHVFFLGLSIHMRQPRRAEKIDAAKILTKPCFGMKHPGTFPWRVRWWMVWMRMNEDEWGWMRHTKFWWSFVFLPIQIDLYTSP